MKHGFLGLAFACLAGCGGSAPATTPPNRLSTASGAVPGALITATTLPATRPTVRFDGRTVQLCTQPANSAVKLCRRAPQPRQLGRIVYATAASFDGFDHAFGPSDIVALNIDSRQQAWLCKYSPASTICLPINAPLPPNVDIKFWTMPDGYHVVSYAHRPNTPVVYDPDARVTKVFEAALEATAEQLRNNTPSAGAALVTSKEQSTDDAPNCGMNTDPDCDKNGDDNDPNPPSSPGDDRAPGGGDGSDGGWDDGWNPGGGWDRMGTPYAGLPTVPDDTASYAANSCSSAATPGFIVICITGNRPPPPAVDTMPLPTGPAPWFPQSWCDAASILCSNGQMPRSPESGKTLDELVEACHLKLRVDVDICHVDAAMRNDWQRYIECTATAELAHTACVTRARDLTDNGAHPAP